MMMCSDLLKVGFVTVHIPVSKPSARSISKERHPGLEAASPAPCSLIQDFSVREPRIAVLSPQPPRRRRRPDRNRKNEQIIAPAIQAPPSPRRYPRVRAISPPTDSSPPQLIGKYDAVLAMYHDQGLAPFKALSRRRRELHGRRCPSSGPARRTAWVSTSPGRTKPTGTAMRDAIYMAIDVLRSRQVYDEISRRPAAEVQA